ARAHRPHLRDRARAHAPQPGDGHLFRLAHHRPTGDLDRARRARRVRPWRRARIAVVAVAPRRHRRVLPRTCAAPPCCVDRRREQRDHRGPRPPHRGRRAARLASTKRSFGTVGSMRRAVIAGGFRTPFVRAGTDLADADVLELSTTATAETLARTETSPGSIDEIVYGNVSRPVAYHNLAREIVLALDLPPSIYASSVGMACASACVAITDASDHIAVGTADAVLAGGAESLSNVPITYTPKLARALVRASQARTLPQRVTSFASVRLGDLAPVAPGIRETSTGLTMGESAERMAGINGITREEQDRWALRSHTLAAKGTDDGRLRAEVVPI